MNSDRQSTIIKRTYTMDSIKNLHHPENVFAYGIKMEN